VLRRHGPYSSHLTEWRKGRGAGGARPAVRAARAPGATRWSGRTPGCRKRTSGWRGSWRTRGQREGRSPGHSVLAASAGLERSRPPGGAPAANNSPGLRPDSRRTSRLRCMVGLAGHGQRARPAAAPAPARSPRELAAAAAPPTTSSSSSPPTGRTVAADAATPHPGNGSPRTGGPAAPPGVERPRAPAGPEHAHRQRHDLRPQGLRTAQEPAARATRHPPAAPAARTTPPDVPQMVRRHPQDRLDRADPLDCADPQPHPERPLPHGDGHELGADRRARQGRRGDDSSRSCSP
jgi:hypothetical protein